MSIENIPKLEEVILLGDGKTITEQKINRLTAPGENYGSLMLSVDITVEGPDGKKEEISAVAKMIPPNDRLQEIFNTQVTFRNEIGFYKNVLPALRDFQREHGVQEVIDFTPKYFGSRLNLRGDDSKVDSDAVLLLENLKVANFKNLERTEGFDLDTSRLVLKDLAHLHGVTLALKLQKPDVFEKEVKPFLATMRVDDDDHINDAKENIKNIIESIDTCRPLLSRIMNTLNKPRAIPREPFATLTHNDFWVNNVMIKMENGKPIKNKIVDFQICDYGSPAKDVLFFLFSSVQNDILEKHYDELIRLYYDTFTLVLQELKCDPSQFSFEEFEKELVYEAKDGQIAHVIFMFFPIFAPKGDIKDFTEFDPDTLLNMKPTELHKQKLAFVIKEFVKRNWI